MAGWEEKYAYEPTSIMHYANKAFAIVTGTDTMKSLTNVDINSMGKSKHLTKVAINRIVKIILIYVKMEGRTQKIKKILT